MNFKEKRNKDLCIESKSVILIEHIEKLANVCLSDDNLIKPELQLESQCKINQDNSKICTIRSIVQESLSKGIKVQKKLNEDETGHVKELLITSRSSKLVRRYFNVWRENVKKKKRPDTGLIKKEKINKFLERLKSFESMNKINDEVKTDKSKSLSCYRSKPKVTNETFKNRLKSQQDIIQNQKTQLNEQKKIIENLRLGIIQEETTKSLSDSKNQIREIFRRCSGRVRCKITPPEAIENDINVIELRCSKPPKVLQEMEKRAEERMIKRQIILERKKVLDERKKQEAAEALEKKKTADEEDRKKNLEAIKERRRLEAETIKIKELKRKEFLENIHKADRFYNKKLKIKVFNGLKKIIEMVEENLFKAEIFYDDCIQKRCFLNWNLYTNQKVNERNKKSDELLKYKVKTKCFKAWKMVLIMQKQSLQVAEDIFDMKLESKMFMRWKKFYEWEQIIDFKKMEIAQKHYERKIQVHYFYLWKSLPAVIQLEKAKEEKKRKWREKVWEIIPDYKPYRDESIIFV